MNMVIKLTRTTTRNDWKRGYRYARSVFGNCYLDASLAPEARTDRLDRMGQTYRINPLAFSFGMWSLAQRGRADRLGETSGRASRAAILGLRRVGRDA